MANQQHHQSYWSPHQQEKWAQVRNLKRVCQELGENMTDDELKEMMDWADKDGDGVLNEDEFINAVMRKKD